VANWYNADTLTASPSQVNFLIFVAVFTFVVIAYLEITPRYAKRGKYPPSFPHRVISLTMTFAASHPYIHLALESLLSLFYFAGFIALSVFLSKLLFCRGSVCAAAKAAVTVSVSNWLLWSLTTIMLAWDIFKEGYRKRRAARLSAKLPAVKEKETV
jgi:hypothetical protein